MESHDIETEKEEHERLTVDLSKQTLKRLERASEGQESAVTLILDHNEIQRLDNLETYPNLRKLSLVNNQLFRMYGVSHLIYLESLDLSNNSLVTIEGLKDLKELKYLNLAKNRIKTIEHLNTNLKLEKIDLSENNIIRISDMFYLVNLKELQLHGNRISHLTHCEKKLPTSLEVLTLSNNSIADLNEVSHLVNLTSLKELSIVNNPCLDFSEEQKFNYRPFVKNWCSSLIILDNCPLDDIECLKAEWLYSQGRGRSFRLGEHTALIDYLISVCPREAEENAETEDVKKLKLILSKAQLHQQQLRDQLSTGKFSGGETYRCSLLKKKTPGTSERMVTSFQDSPEKRDFRSSSDLMTRSLDSGITRKYPSKLSRADLNQTPLQTSTTFIPIPDTLVSPDVGQPISGSYPRPSSLSSRTSRSSSRNSQHSTTENRKKPVVVYQKQMKNTSPVAMKTQDKLSISRSSTPLDLGSSAGLNYSPKNIGSPRKTGARSRESERNCRETSEEEDSEILALRIKAVQQRATQRRQNRFHQADKIKEKNENSENFEENKLKMKAGNCEMWKAAVCIQRRWRGYRARNLNGDVLAGCKDIQMSRMQDYITKVVSDMEATRSALEGNRKLVVLQMQAINALWKKMAALQPAIASHSEDNKASLQNLMETCATLNKQVERLQEMMKAMQTSSTGPLIPMATQTEIVAVHTPQGEGNETFPYAPKPKPETTSSTTLRDAATVDKCTDSTVTEIYINTNINDTSEKTSWSGSVEEKECQFLGENSAKHPTGNANEDDGKGSPKELKPEANS